jgi:hypothetical protein
LTCAIAISAWWRSFSSAASMAATFLFMRMKWAAFGSPRRPPHRCLGSLELQFGNSTRLEHAIV